MLLYCNTITPRLQYIVDFFNKELFEEPISITADSNQFEQASGPKLNYSSQEFAGPAFSIHPVELLFESSIRPQAIHCFTTNGHAAFFSTSGDFPFDIFAASFYLLSRYEEYLPH